MLALQKTRDDQGLELCDVAPPPPPAAHEVRIQIAATGICGTDLGIEKWGAGYSAMMANALPVTLGHETVGRISAIGEGVTGLAIGDAVVVNPAIACDECAACRAGDRVGCLDRQPVGMVLDGAFARQLNVPAAYAYRLPDHIPLELGALIEPLSVGAYALDVAGMKAGDRVIVFGPGPIGQGVALLAREMGASDVAIVGMNDAARFDTLRALGFHQLFDLGEADTLDRLTVYAGAGFDIAIEAAGVASVMDQAMALLRPLGVLAMAGLGDKPGSLDVGLLVRKRLSIHGVSRIPPRIWPLVIDLMARRPEAYAALITHRLPLSQAIDAFALARAGQASKILLIPED